MAINYAQLFGDTGEFVQRVNDFYALYAALDTDFSEIEADLDSSGRQDVLTGIYDIFEQYKGNVLGWIGLMIDKTSQRITNRDSVLDELRLEATDAKTVLIELWRDMVANAQTIERSSVTIGAVSEDKTNTNAGSVLIDKVLDGVSEPHNSYPANWYYNGENSELAGAETVYVQCILDSESDGLTEGAEQFRIDGTVLQPSPYHWNAFGSGPGPTFTTLQGASLMSNFEFEDFTSNVPDSWTLDSGTAGTHVSQDTVTIHRGSSALELTGDAAQANIQISQVVPAGVLQPRKRYLVGFWVKGHASISAGTLTIQFEGTGYAAAASEKVEMNAAALAAIPNFTFKYFYINWPTEPSDDMELVIKWTGTPSAHSVFIDGGGIAAPVWHNGLNFIAYAGSEKFLRQDRFSSAITNDEAGVFQKFFRLAYGIQLPSDAAPSIADTLAT